MKRFWIIALIVLAVTPVFSQAFVQELYTGARVDTLIATSANKWYTFSSSTGYWNKWYISTTTVACSYVVSFGDTTLYKCVVPAGMAFNDYMPSKTVMIRRYGSAAATFYINQWR